MMVMKGGDPWAAEGAGVGLPIARVRAGSGDVVEEQAQRDGDGQYNESRADNRNS
jgi:acyl CoA:acetate/3-ketoacid CoA transferase alpha subunit